MEFIPDFDFISKEIRKCESGERFSMTGTWSPGNCSSKGDLPSKNKYIGHEEGKKASWEKVRKTFPLFIIESKKKKGLTVIGSPPIGCRFIHKKRKYRPVEKNQACFCFLLVLAANYWFVLQNLFSISPWHFKLHFVLKVGRMKLSFVVAI